VAAGKDVHDEHQMTGPLWTGKGVHVSESDAGSEMARGPEKWSAMRILLQAQVSVLGYL
jgi:hypothetical protein